MSKDALHTEHASEDGLRIFGLVPDSIVDGPGLRYSVFVQGCSHKCEGCHNPESHDPLAGTWHTLDAIHRDIVDNKLITGITFSGGEPFEQAEGCAKLAAQLKEEGYDIWVYSGYTYEALLERAAHDLWTAKLLTILDVLVDGPFVQKLQSYDLDWRGSSNQRIIDMAKTRESGTLNLWEKPTIEFAKPPSW